MSISLRFACRRRTAAEWTSLNEVLLAGEWGVETDLLPDDVKAKIGDGVTPWDALGYAVDTTAAGGGGVWGAISGTLTDQADLVAALAGKETAGAAATAQAFAIQRSNHTGTQAQSTVANLVSDLALKADLVGGVIPSAQIPAIAITEYLGSVGSQAAMLALSGQKGDWALRSDLGTTWVITGNDPTQLADWTQLSYPTAPVTSVNTQTGAVTLAAADVGAATAAQGAKADTAVQPADLGDLATLDVADVLTDAIANGVTTKAPSQNAVFDALALKAATGAAGRLALELGAASALAGTNAALRMLPDVSHPLVRGIFLSSAYARNYKNTILNVGTVGTLTNITYATLPYIKSATAATASQTFQQNVNSPDLFTSGGAINGYLAWQSIYLPDASYGSGATGVNLCFGASSNAAGTFLSTTLRIASGQVGAVFNYNTNLSDTNWQFSVRDGSGITTADTGLPFTAQHAYVGFIHAPSGDSNTYYYIADLTAGTSAFGSVARQHGSTACYQGCFGVTLDNVARSMATNDIWALIGGAL